MTRTPPASTSGRRRRGPRDLVRPGERRDDGAVAVAPLSRAPARRRRRAPSRRPSRRARRRRDAAPSVTPARRPGRATVASRTTPAPRREPARPTTGWSLATRSAGASAGPRPGGRPCARERGAARERRRAARVERAGDGHAAVERRGLGRADVPVAAHGEHVAAPPAGAHARQWNPRRRGRLQAQNPCPSRTGLHSDTIEACLRPVVVAGVPPPAARHRHFPVARSQSPWFEHGACSRSRRDRVLQGACGVRRRGRNALRTSRGRGCRRAARVRRRRRRPLVEGDEPPVGRWEQDAFWTVGSELIARPHVRRRAPGSSTPAGTRAQPAVDLAARRRRDGQRDRARPGSASAGRRAGWICSQAAPVTPGWQMQNEVERVASGAEQ